MWHICCIYENCLEWQLEHSWLAELCTAQCFSKYEIITKARTKSNVVSIYISQYFLGDHLFLFFSAGRLSPYFLRGQMANTTFECGTLN